MTELAERLKRLSQQARALPKVPGVYLMKDVNGVVLYVGKAKVLPNRVASYFQASTDLGVKKDRMLPRIDHFDTIECQDEWEALLTENRLIKDLHPEFNERLTDDKTFPYLVITMQDDFPGVYITRQPSEPRFRGAHVLGPFTSVYALRESVQLLQRVFKFRTCELSIEADDPKLSLFRPCLLHPIDQCTAPCAAKIDRAAYREDIKRFIRFMGSKRSVMLRQMDAEMKTASAAMAYEKAAKLRDQIQAIEKLDQRGRRSDQWQPEIESFYVDPKKGLASLQKALGLAEPIRCLECIDIAHLQGQETVGSKVCFVDGRPLKSEYRRYKIKQAGNDDYASIAEVVDRAYGAAGAQTQLYPDVVIIDGGQGQLTAAMAVFDLFDVAPKCVIALAKKEELIYAVDRTEPIRLSRNHLGLKLCQAIRDEAHRFAQAYHHHLRKKRMME